MDDDIIIRFIRNVAFKTFIKARILVSFIGWRFLDVFGLIWNLIVLVTVIRIPAFVYAWRNHREQTHFAKLLQWRFLGLVQVLILIVDIPFLLMVPFLLLCFWRAILVYKQHGPIKYSTDLGYEGWKLRSLIFKHFCLLWCDLFAIPLTLVIVFSWRAPTFFRKMRQETSEVGWKKIIFREFCMVVLDFFTFPIFIILFHTWRRSTLIDKYYYELHKNKHGHYRRTLNYDGRHNHGWKPHSGIHQKSTFYSVLGDIIEETGANALKFKFMVFREWVLFCLDLLTIPPILLLAVSWRSPILYRIYLALYTGLPDHRGCLVPNEGTSRAQVWFHVVMLVLDVITLVPLILVCCSWRVVFFIIGFKSKPLSIDFHSMSSTNTHNSTNTKEVENLRRIHSFYNDISGRIWKEALTLIIDIPVVVEFIVVTLLSVVFPWRLTNILDKLVKRFHVSQDPEKNLAMSQNYVRQTISEEFVSLCCDIPAALMLSVVVVTGWRLPFLIENLLYLDWANEWTVSVPAKDGTEMQSLKLPSLSSRVWGVIRKEFGLLLLDILTGGLVAVIICTLWRIYPFIISVKDTVRHKEDEPVDPQSGETIVHIPRANSGLQNKPWNYLLSKFHGPKIRKSALMNVAFLLVDIPALLLLVINLVCVIRVPSIINKLLNCGSVFLEFPLVMLQESGKLVVDILHIFLGFFLLIARPIAIVENLCEDEDHRRLRELKKRIHVLKLYLKKRDHYEESVESILSILIKSYKDVDENYAKLLFAQSFVAYSESLSEVRQALFDKDLDVTAIYHLSKLIFIQNKYPHYVARKFLIEKKYLTKPSLQARERNLKLYDEEFDAYRTVLSNLYKTIDDINLESVPLWSKKIGFMTRSRTENHKVLKKTLTEGYFVNTILCIVNILFIYRAPGFIYLLWKEPVLVKRKAQANLKEYILDAKCVIQILMVVLSIYRCPFLLSDLLIDIFCKQSVNAIRKTVDSYPPQILQDILHILKLVFRWRSIAYIISSTLFFILMPLSAVITLIRQLSSSRAVIYISSVTLYLLIFAVPLTFINYLQRSTAPQDLAAAFFVCYFLVLTGVLALFVLVRSKSSFVLPNIDYVRLNWANIHVCLQEFIETGQIFALLFSINSMAFPHADSLRDFFKFFLLDFGDTEMRASMNYYLFIAWFLTCSVPVVLEGILEYVPKGTFSKKHFAWQSYLSLFGSSLFLCIPNMVITDLACDNPEVACWSQQHASVAMKGALCLIWYLITSTLFCTKYITLDNKMLDLRFSPIYSATLNLIKFVLVLVIGYNRFNKMSALTNTIEIILFMIVFTLFLMFCGVKLCNSKLLMVWRLHSFCVTLFSACMILVLEGLGITNPLAFYTVAGIVVSSYIILFISSFYIRSYSDNELARAEFIKTLQEIVTVLESNDNFIGDWDKIKSPWMRMVQVVRVANEADKDAEDHRDQVFIVETAELVEEAPPSYQDVTSISEELPPSYKEAQNPTPPATEHDEYFLPTVEYFTSPIGEWKMYDTVQIIEQLKWMTDKQSVDIVSTLTDRRCTGSDILLLLEQHIHYQSLSYHCVTNLESWRKVVKKSDWIGLAHCAKALQQTISCRYEFPPTELAARARVERSDLIPRNPDFSGFPVLIDLSTVHEIKVRIHKREREKFLSFLPKPWKIVFSTLISEDFPMIHKFVIETGTEWDVITLEMFTQTNIIIKNVIGTGFKIARGAYINLPKTINIKKINDDFCAFAIPYPCAGKGPLSKDLTLFKCVMRGEEMRIGIGDQAKTCQISKVLDTLAELRWEGISSRG